MGRTERRHRCGVALGLFLLVFAGVDASAEPLTLTWDPNPDASVKGYVVYVGNASRRYSSSVDVGSSTSFNLPELDQSQRYYFAVASYDHNGTAGEPSVELLWGQGPPVNQDPPVSLGPPVNGGLAPSPIPATDTKPPVIAITTPTVSERSQTFGHIVVVGGVASDESAVASIEWKNSRGDSGQATGTEAWLAAIPLRLGINELKITARDGAGNRATTVLVLLRHPLGVRRSK